MKDGLANGNLTIWYLSGAMKSKSIMANGGIKKNKSWHANKKTFFTLNSLNGKIHVDIYINERILIIFIKDINSTIALLKFIDDANTYGLKNLKINIDMSKSSFSVYQKLKFLMNTKRLSFFMDKENRKNIVFNVENFQCGFENSLLEVKKFSKISTP